MEIIIEKNYNSLSKKAAEIIASFIKQNPNCALGLATGSTPQKTYKILCRKCQAGEISFRKIKTFNLDEYSGLEKENEQSYKFFMQKHLFSKTDINRKNTFFPTDFAPNYSRYDKTIKQCGGIDLQILGIGRNGHIGFNEPGSSFSSKTREIKLAKTTIKDNARFFKDKKDVPRKAVTMGLGTIIKAKKIVLLASGENKKNAVYTSLYGKISAKVPASVLQKHKNVIVILDKEAAEKINKGL